MKTTASIEQQLADLRKLDEAALRTRYERVYGKAVRRRASLELLRQAVANRLHQLLLSRIRSKLQRVLNAGEAIVSILEADTHQTELVCEWKGRVHTIALVEDGALFRGRHFSSLSAVAYAITGKKMSWQSLLRPGSAPSEPKVTGKAM